MPSALPPMEQQLLKQPKPDVTEGENNDPRPLDTWEILCLCLTGCSGSHFSRCELRVPAPA